MSFKIDRGLFKYDLIDYHAILCIPLDADVKEIRKSYLKIARRLHPDSCTSNNPTEKQLASELLSKLVNPAYEKLSNERNRTEYMIVLSQMGKHLAQESGSVELTTDAARQLAAVPAMEQRYKTGIAKIALTQYDSLEQVLQVIALVSELNLVYLIRNAASKLSTPPPSSAQAKADTSGSKQPTVNKNSATVTPDLPVKETSVATQYLRRAQDLMVKNQLEAARVELQDALKLEPHNSRCHGLIGMVYLKQNQTTMAKIHFDRALQLDPTEEIALEGKRKIEQISGKKPGNAKPAASLNNGAKQQDKSGGGGLFGGLFGGKKN